MMVNIKTADEVISCESGSLLGEIIALHDHFDQPCAGKRRCGKCLVTVKGDLSEPSEEELILLSEQQRANGVRLACCCRVLGDCEIVPPTEGEIAVSIGGFMPEFTHNPAFKGHGISVDIGTTTLALQLYSGSALLAQASDKNPQASFGADVISRIEHSLAGEGEQLADCIKNGICELVEELLVKSGIDRNSVDMMVVTGNTTMLYLLNSHDPEALSHAPFEADRLYGGRLPKGFFGCCPSAEVYLPRCISAFIGADISTAVLASGMCEKQETALLMDIGTNGELALWHEGKLLCCSTAMGPAFEGATLSCGMMGRTGAVYKVAMSNDKIVPEVIGGVKPIGICGSGVVDLVACMLATEDLDETGYLEDEEFLFARDVSFTQKDIRMVQLAKASLAAGVIALLNRADINMQDIKQLYIAGGFGSNINIQNAAAIGLIPKELTDRVEVLGNAALSGASMLLLAAQLWEKLEEIAKNATTYENSTDPVFMDAYVENMMF